VYLGDLNELASQRSLELVRKHRHAIFRALTVANDDFVSGGVRSVALLRLPMTEVIQ